MDLKQNKPICHYDYPIKPQCLRVASNHKPPNYPTSTINHAVGHRFLPFISNTNGFVVFCSVAADMFHENNFKGHLNNYDTNALFDEDNVLLNGTSSCPWVAGSFCEIFGIYFYTYLESASYKFYTKIWHVYEAVGESKFKLPKWMTLLTQNVEVSNSDNKEKLQI